MSLYDKFQGMLNSSMSFLKMTRQEAESQNYKLQDFEDAAKESSVDPMQMSVFSRLERMKEEGATAFGYDSTSFGNFLYGSISTNKAVRVSSYRRMSDFPEVSDAIDEICDHSVNRDENGKTCTVVDVNDKFEGMAWEQIEKSFDEYVSLFDFDANMFEYMRSFVMDGEMCWENIITNKHKEFGIVGVNRIRPEAFEFAFDLKSGLKSGINVLLQAQSSGTNLYSTMQQGTDAQKSQAQTQGNLKVQNLQAPNSMGMQGTSNDKQTVFLPWEQLTYVSTGNYSPDGLIVWPVLEKARKAYNQLSLIEDAIVIFRLARAPSRYVFNVDVGNLNRARAEQEVQKLMKRHQTKKYYNPATGSVSNDYDPTSMLECKSMDTKVLCLDGRTLSISEIEQEMKLGKQLWTYSCDPKTGRIVPGKIDFAGVTRPNAEVVKVTLDNGEEIICTPDHAFPVWEKGRVEAQDMIPGDSIISFQRKTQKLDLAKGYGGDYEYVFDHSQQDWIATHRMVAEFFRDTDMYQKHIFDVNKNERMTTVHHKNMKHQDNSPENLVWMGYRDHFMYHSKELNFWKNAPEDQKIAVKEKLRIRRQFKVNDKLAQGVVLAIKAGSITKDEICAFLNSKKSYLKEFADLHADIYTVRKDKIPVVYIDRLMRHLGFDRLKLMVKHFNPEVKFRTGFGQHVKEQPKIKFDHDMLKMLIDAVKSNPEIKQAELPAVFGQGSQFAQRFAALNKDNMQLEDLNVRSWHTLELVRSFGYKNYRHFKMELCNHNHRVVSVERLSERMDTGCIAVDLYEKYHNYHTFALAAGVYTYNSFWFIKPSGGGGTEVQNLESSASYGELDDLKYFLRKLYLSLKVPYQRYEKPETMIDLGQKDTGDINYEELKFCKFVMRLQDCFARALKQGFLMHLKLKGITEAYHIRPRDLNVKFVPPSQFDAFMAKHLLTIKMELYSKAVEDEAFSKTLAMKEHLNWTDEEVEENWKAKEEETLRQALIDYKKDMVMKQGQIKRKNDYDRIVDLIEPDEEYQEDEEVTPPEDQPTSPEELMTQQSESPEELAAAGEEAPPEPGSEDESEVPPEPGSEETGEDEAPPPP